MWHTRWSNGRDDRATSISALVLFSRCCIYSHLASSPGLPLYEKLVKVEKGRPAMRGLVTNINVGETPSITMLHVMASSPT